MGIVFGIDLKWCLIRNKVMPKRKQWKLETMLETMLTTMEDNVKAHDRERKRIARSKPETRARQNALQRERRALKRQQAINPHDDNIKHTKCVQTPSLYSPSCSCPLKDTFNSSSSVTPFFKFNFAQSKKLITQKNKSLTFIV
ncbi:hypothetical protein CDAR_437971 [Caerostris darwini]|uniref:Uncharacterized protein n=1 Tax=Caerostris darwini TaxID=1538125 RepID=A0AAV4TW39_9ARAC|nr:hypothetical protein CDAR_437971 [Caerostris darwini]